MANIQLKTLKFPGLDDTYALPTFYTLEDDAGNVEIVFSINKPIINFSIDGTTYQAEYGMTWTDWLASDYNPEVYYYNSSSNTGNVIAVETN